MFGLFKDKNINIGIGVDIGYNSIKMVELDKKDDIISIQNYAEVELASYASLEMGQSVNIGDEGLIRAVKDMWASLKPMLKNVYVSIPATESYIFAIDVPIVPDADLENTIQLEIRKYLPLPIAELLVDHWPIPTGAKDGKTKVSVIAVKKSVVDRYIEIFKKADINILGFEMETFSAVRAMSLTDKNYLLIDTGGSATTITLVVKGILYKSVTVQVGGANITSVIKNSLMKNSYKDTEIMKRRLINKEIEDNSMMNIIDMATYPLLEELGHIGENLEREYNVSVDEIIFIGGNAHACVSSLKIKSCFKVKANVGEPFKNIKYATYLSDLVDRIGGTYAVSTGLALKAFN